MTGLDIFLTGLLSRGYTDGINTALFYQELKMSPNLTEIATTTTRHRDKKMTKRAAKRPEPKLINHQAEQRSGIRNTIADAIKSSKKPLKSVKVKFK